MRNTASQEQRRWDEFFAFNKALMTTGWRQDAYRFKATRSYPCFDGSADISAQARVGQDNAALASVTWDGKWTDVAGGGDGSCTVRSDQSCYFRGHYNGLARFTGIDALKNVQIRTDYLDDGTKSGGVELGLVGTHDKLHHEFTTTMGNRVARFQEFLSYGVNDKWTVAVSSQGQLMNMMNGLKVQIAEHYCDGGANIGTKFSFANTPSGWSHLGGSFMVQYKNAAGHEVGSFADFDKLNKKMTMSLAARLNLQDHDLAMRVDNSGTAKFLFGWKQNSAVNAQVGTQVNLTDFAKGKLSGGLPLSMQFDMKY